MKGGARNNKPAALRALHGSKIRPRHRGVVEGSPVGTLKPPAGLTPVEREVWVYYVPVLAALRVLSAGDRDTLVQYCIGVGQVREIRAQQQDPRYRRLVGTRTHPLDAQLRHWMQLTRLAAAELGLSPVSRARATPIGPRQETDALEDFITAPLHRIK